MQRTRKEIYGLNTLLEVTSQLLGELGRQTHANALNDFGALIDEIEEIHEEKCRTKMTYIRVVKPDYKEYTLSIPGKLLIDFKNDCTVIYSQEGCKKIEVVAVYPKDYVIERIKN
jgi:hypothetical protein